MTDHGISNHYHKQKMNNILLFLDFDGVLHPSSGHAHFKEDCMSALSSIITKHPEIRIVITSSWREEKTVDELKVLLGKAMGERVLGVTPVIDEPFMHNVRYHEVLSYLKRNSLPNASWFAIDDEPGSYPDHAHVILTDRRKGFTEDNGSQLDEMVKLVRKVDI